MPDGNRVAGGRTRDTSARSGGVFVGSEGTFGIAPRSSSAFSRSRRGEDGLAVFDEVSDASAAVSAIIARGLVRRHGVIDNLTIQAVEDAFQCGYRGTPPPRSSSRWTV